MGLEKYEYQSDFAKRFFAEGEVTGEARGEARGRRATLLAVLDARGLQPTQEHRERIEGCDDVELLEQWARAAVNAASVTAVFGEDE